MKYSFGTPPPVAPLTTGMQRAMAGPKTIMIAGLERGGTSATAAAVDALGIPIGHSCDGHYESIEFKADPFFDESWSKMQERICALNATHNYWGTQVWANPAHICRLGCAMRNPHLILVFRDSVAVAQRRLKIGGYGDSLQKVMAQILIGQFQLWGLSQTDQMPVLLISFERLRITPDIVVRHIADFLRLQPNEDSITDACNRITRDGGYIIQTRDGYRKP